ncbi:hypothetical protein MXEN_01734 [Mycobacterium xenopi RIVM700367]|uniref:hypothetical protein n=1 Tax=Mycobacterium xenopi TaxID=1789 RepID=UPI00025ACBE6|nr:hypothetical protein [Mycobacterium xenopi]EID17143.1 hypothetical protein MXEN_01734 [Mycobacterium xenopi RIVM700367]
MAAKTSPDTIAEQLAAAEAEAQRLRDRQAAIEQAERDARDATELRLFKEAYIGQDNYRQRRDEAKKRLDELAAGQHLDLAELLAAFDEFQRLDAQAGAAAAHASRLNQIDPLPPRANGAPRTRPTRVQRLTET